MGLVIPIVCLIVGLLLIFMGSFNVMVSDTDSLNWIWTWLFGFPMTVFAIYDLTRKKNWKKL